MTVETAVTSHRLPRSARILVAARAVDRLGGFTMTFLPLLLVTSYDAPRAWASVAAASFGLATIPSRLLGGRLADRLGHRTTICLGLTGCAVAQLGLAAAGTLWHAAVAAVALGLCFEIYEPPSQAMLADVVPAEQRSAGYAALAAAIAGAGVLAGLLAAVLAPFGLRWLFVADAVTCLACAVVVRLFLPSIGRPPVPDGGGTGSSPWRDRRLLLLLAAGVAFTTVDMVMLTGLPLALHDDGAAAWWAGVLAAVAAVTTILAQRRLRGASTDPFGRMRRAYVVLTLALLLAAVVGTLAPSGPAYVVPVIAWSAAMIVLLAEPMAVVADLAPAHARGRYLAAYGVAWGVATTLAPVLATGLLALGGAGLLWLVCAGAAGALAAAQGRLGAAVART